MSKRKYYFSVIFLIVLGFSVRLIGISNLPSGFNQDEASIGYEAYSILKTGIDRNGNSYPVHLESWGSGQNALYAYLSMPFIHFFGLNVFSVRIVNALASCISLLFFYLLFKILFNEKKALAALALFAIFPWSIMSARWGLESNIFPNIFLAAIFFLIKGYTSTEKYYPISFLLFSLSLYSYGTSYLILPIFFSLILPYLIVKKKISYTYLFISLTIFFIAAIPIILFVLINQFDLQQIQFWDVTIPKMDANRTTVIFNLFNDNIIYTLGKNIIRFLSILVLQSDGNEYNSIPMFGTIYPLSFVFFIIGLWGVIKSKNLKVFTHHYIFISWLFCSIILGITSHVNINRINIIFIPLLYFVVLGIFDAIKMLKPTFQNKYKFLIIGLYTLFFIFFMGYYNFIFKEEIKNDFSYGLKEAIDFANVTNKTDCINITKETINMPYIYVCFYNQFDPNTFRKSVKYNANSIYTGFREVDQLGRYTFGTNLLLPNTIYILSKNEISLIRSSFSSVKEFGNYYVVVKK